MNRRLVLALILALPFICIGAFAKTQQPTEDLECNGPVYSGKQVSRRVKILSYPPPDMPTNRQASEVEGEVILNVVACQSGKITNIEVVKPLPHGLTEEAIKAARRVKFRPAEKDGQVASQFMRFHYSFHRN